MNRLLIVDDEHHIVNWLADLFENQKHMDFIVYKAYSGIEALKILETNKINVILLDIKMPGLNGLEVADQIFSHWPGCRIIFLTGYNYFDYIYEANKHKNITYLLKTESDAEIIKAVTLAMDSIAAEIKNLNLKNEVSRKEKLVQYLLQKELLKDLILGKHVREMKDHIMKYNYGLELDMTQPVFLLYGKLSSKEPPYFIDHSKRILNLMQITEQVLFHKFRYALLDYTPATIVWLLQPLSYADDKSCWDPRLYLKESFDDFIAACQNNLSQDIALLLYYKEVSWDSISFVFSLLHQYLQQYLSAGNVSFGMIFSNTEENVILSKNKKSFPVHIMEKQLAELSFALHQGNEPLFLNLLKEIGSLCMEIKSMHDLTVISIYQRISAMFITYINQWHLTEKLCIQMETYPLYIINYFNTWEEAFAYLTKLSRLIFKLYNSTQNDKNLIVIKTLKAFIKENLSQDLTLTRLSDWLNYNSSYVSRLFRQVTGERLSDYITTKRIEKAKELLMNSEDTIQEIAQKVGFDTSQYFSMVFKKITGMSPRDYRINSIAQNENHCNNSVSEIE